VNEPIFRHAVPSDWKAIRTLLAENKLPLEGARDHLGAFIVAQDETGLMACGGLELYGPAALLRSVAVKKDHRGKRLGQKLLAELYAEAVKERVEVLVLLTDTAKEYFRHLGFKVVPRADLPSAVTESAEFKGACPDTAIAMVMNLSGPK